MIKKITLRQARRFLLAYQGLWPPYRIRGKSGILEFLRKVSCIQFDPLNIVGQNPDLVLQARVGDYRPAYLQELLYQDRKLLDGWDKNMSIYPVDDWPYFARQREAAYRRPGKSPEAVRSVAPRVRAEIAARGPLSSIDLEMSETVDWAWAPTRLARAALESMYFWGELIVHHKVHTRKVYDFAHRHLPPALLEAGEPNPTDEQYADWYVLRRIGSVGMLWNRSSDAWLGAAGLKTKERQAALERLLAQGMAVEVQIEGLQAPFYIRQQDQAQLDEILNAGEPEPQAVVIAPLDNLLWDRRMVKELFGFDYRWEVYKPVQDRTYGYYVLPILYGDRLIARFEPGRARDNGAVVIKNWWWEEGVIPTDEIQSAIQNCFGRFLRYLGADHLQLNDGVGEQAGLTWLVV